MSLLKVEYLQELSCGVPFVGLDAEPTGNATGDQGRNHKLKGMIAAALDAGEYFTKVLSTLMQYDLKNGDLFGDQSDPQMRGKERQENALRFIQSVMKSINGKRRQSGLTPQKFRLDNGKATSTGRAELCRIVLTDHGAEKFTGTPAPIPWQYHRKFRQGAAYLVCGEGGIGKGTSVLNLCQTSAFPKAFPFAFGSRLELPTGTAVYITSEDAADEVHRRLHVLDPTEQRLKYPNKLIIVPMPDNGGVRPIIEGTTTTDFYQDLREQLLAIPDLRVVCFDTIQSLCLNDFEKSNKDAQYIASVLAELAAATGALVLGVHHLRKGEVKDSGTARAAIRGASGLVDGMRGAFVFWPAVTADAKDTCRLVKTPYAPNKVIQGAMVKANSGEDMSVLTFIRNADGMLEDHSAEVKKFDSGSLQCELLASLRKAWDAGHPFHKTGQSGIYERRGDLPETFRKFGRDKLRGIIDDLDADGLVTITKGGIKCSDDLPPF